jgi:hypothetical protein
VLVARRFAFLDFNLKAEALILAALACTGLAYEATKMTESVVLCPPDSPKQRQTWRKTEITAGDHNCLPPGMPTCYPRSVNRNIFYIIGVIVVIVIVLKVLHVF